MNKFWIILPLSPDAQPTLRPIRYDYLEDARTAIAAQAVRQPTKEGYALLECIGVTGEPAVVVELESPAPAKERPKEPSDLPAEPAQSRAVAGFRGTLGIAAPDEEVAAKP